MMMKRRVAALMLCAPIGAYAQPVQQDGRSAKIDSMMASWVERDGPGAAVIVIQDGKIMHQRGYGLANRETKEPITINTTFDLASVSKQFTAMAIMMLSERGKLAYSDPLTKFFPEFPAYATKITVRHLLNHTSGLPDYMEVYEKRSGAKGFEPTSREALAMLAEVKAPLFEPGAKFEYSNSGYMVLGQIVEKASGASFPAFLKTNIFDPLGMTSTIVSDQIKAPSPNRAISYKVSWLMFTNADYSPLNKIYGDGNVNTSVQDMYKWDQALYTDRLVKQSTLAEAFSPAKLNNGSTSDYGFGWRTADRNGVHILAHGGSWAGFRTYIIRVPSERFSIVVLSNSADFTPGVAAARIARLYLGDKFPE